MATMIAIANHGSSAIPALYLTLILALYNILISNNTTVSANAIFSLKYRYAGTNRSLNSLKAHDTNRLKMLSNVALPIGGTGRPDSFGLYYTKVGIGDPSNSYYMQVDTGSDVMWVNCIECTECPERGYHGMELTLYNPKDSLTAKLLSCDGQFCLEVNGGPLMGCKPNLSCTYAELYGDGSSSTGYFVKDIIQYDQVSGDLETSAANGSVFFGCSAGEFVDQGSSDDTLDGVLAFGKANSSIISQLAASGQVRKMFAHCLDGVNGGGIFAIGHIVQPKVNTTPLVQSQPHYTVNMTAVKVGSEFLRLPSDFFKIGGQKGAIIDIGTTLCYFPEVLYEPLVIKILSQRPDLKFIVQDQYTCFQYSESVDDGFPPITFYFENSLSLTVYPHEYLFIFEDMWCVGWQNSGMQSRDKMNLTLLGDLVLSNKLVLYDLENQVIGWTEYNCSSSIQVKDEQTGTVHLVGPQNLSSASSVNIIQAVMILLSLYNIYFLVCLY
ncbi:hypothetical protein Nepgr_024798 [Nepenthes gracilis]|uniref:Peptidase A1 domain-containing protein n=1 Tax=Nepenthes gracilis TaxID=150966 RepID=A0AAD3T3W9_NEPGR|nr:hypothetical protein Nepgr_024798 [Nepenthes gracilis]